MRVVLLTTCLILVLSSGCAERRSSRPDADGKDSSPTKESSPSAIFPHPDDWKNPEVHGAWVIQYDSISCLKCHEASSDKTGSTPPCSSCHPLFPHSPDWVKKENHGTKVLADGKGACATRCHGTDLKGGLSGRSCNLCHSIYPHAATWISPGEHGVAAQGASRADCQACHGDDFSKILDGKNCFSCHEYPHPPSSTWIPFGGGHGEKIKTLSGTSDCEKCHGSDLKTVKGGKNCFGCHPSYPHAKMATGPWKDYEGHGKYALSSLAKTECQPCHGSDYKGGSRGNASCFTAACHASYPHLTGWKRPSGEPQDHGNYVNLNSTASCATARCHGVALVPTPGVTNGPTCSGCHPTYPHPLNWAPPIVPPAWSLHGPVAKADITKCKTCHGNGLDVAPPGSQTCKVCHPTYLSHDTAQMPGVPVGSWKTFGGHGTYLKGIGWNSNACKACHGANYLGGVSLVSCKSSGCHLSYPHDAPGWSGYAGHGFYVLSTLGNVKTPCRLCHGIDLRGGHSEKSCYACHNGAYPHDATWALPANHGVAAYGTGKNTCNSANCHKSTFLGGAPDGPPAGPVIVPSCKGALCHSDYPHNLPNWVAGASSVHASTFIEKMDGDGLGDDPLACQSCHGPGYDRTVPAAPTLNCTTCHPTGITHTTGWKLGTGHGTYFSSRYNSMSTTPCKDCHGHTNLASTFAGGQTRAGLTSQSDCYRCHWAYPHTAYDYSAVFGVVGNWAPAANDMAYWGHAGYVMFSNLLVDSTGQPRTSGNDPCLVKPRGGSPTVKPILQNTCGGGTAGNCHFRPSGSIGYRSSPVSYSTVLCGGYCHASVTPAGTCP